MKDVAVLGIGGVGGFLAAVLARGGAALTCVARGETAATLRREGLRLDSSVHGSFRVRPAVAERLERPVDLLIVATKATGLSSALTAVDNGCLAGGVVVPLLNGLEHMAAIRARLGPRVAAGSIRIEAYVASPGRIVHTSPFALVSIASDGEVPAPRLREAADFLTGHGVETKLGASEASVLWEKLARLAAIACTTALADRPVGELRSDPVWRARLQGALREGVAVANACGVEMTAEAQMRVVDALPPTLTTSMQRDIAAHRPSELDAIAGAVVRAGRSRGVPCPTLEELIRRIESERLRAAVEGRSQRT